MIPHPTFNINLAVCVASAVKALHTKRDERHFNFESSPNIKPKEKCGGVHDILYPQRLKKWGTRSPCPPPNCAHA